MEQGIPSPKERPLSRWGRYPPAAAFSTEVDPPEAMTLSWQLLGSGGYLDAWTDPAEHAALRDAYFSDAGATEHRVVALRESGRACGMVQATRRPNGLLLLHQMALDREQRSHSRGGSLCSYWILQTLFRATSAWPSHFQVFAESARSLSRSIYIDFHAKGWSPWQSDLQYHEIYRATPALGVAAPTPDAYVEVSAPTAGELSPVHEALAPRLAPVERARGPEQSWLRVARIGGRAAAVLMLDEGPQLNVFGVMNTCSLAWLEPCDVALRDALALALLGAAHDRLRARGVVAAILAHPDRELDAVAVQAGFRYVSQGLRWTASAEIIPDYLEHLDHVMVGRDTRG